MDTKKNEIHIEYINLSTLVGAQRNPKDHDMTALSDSMYKFGFTSPLLMNEKTNRIVSGNGRRDVLMMLKSMGKPPPFGIKVDENNNWLVPVVRGLNFGDDDDEAYLIADNRITELGGWDEGLLAEMLSDLAALEKLSGTGFDEEDVDKLMSDMGIEDDEEKEKREELESDIDKLEPSDISLGDVWTVGKAVVAVESDGGIDGALGIIDKLAGTQDMKRFIIIPLLDSGSGADIARYARNESHMWVIERGQTSASLTINTLSDVYNSQPELQYREDGD